MADHTGEDMKGRAKEATGAVTGDEELKREGKVDQASASVKDKVGDAVDSVKDTVTGKEKHRR